MLKATFLRCIATATACSWSCASARPVVSLQPEQAAALHIGEVAAVEVPSDRHYSIGSAGGSLTAMGQKRQRDTTIYLYRTVAAGNQTLVATPRDPGPDNCMSCVTVHYFITVVD